MKRYIIVLLSIVLTLGCCAQRKNNNIGKQNTQQTTTKKSKSATVSKATGTIAGHGYVDLGLPSGLKWATCNVGADKPEDSGAYVAWGETSPKRRYDKENSFTFGQSNAWLFNHGHLDYYGDLTMSLDAASDNWGSTWRMPTLEEVEELIKYTTRKWTTYKGVNGYVVTSKCNGKCIFLPAAGDCNGSLIYSDGVSGYYWTSTTENDNNNSEFSFFLFFTSEDFTFDNWSRAYGLSVRPVSN